MKEKVDVQMKNLKIEVKSTEPEQVLIRGCGENLNQIKPDFQGVFSYGGQLEMRMKERESQKSLSHETFLPYSILKLRGSRYQVFCKKCMEMS